MFGKLHLRTLHDSVLMINQTVCHSASLLLGAEDSVDVGCLVQIYPNQGPTGMWDLTYPSTQVGRVIGNDIVLEDDSVSREHAVLVREDGGYLIRDLGSTNGTYVNDARIEETRLAAGDRVRIGNHIFKFLSADHIEAQYHETVFNMMTRDGLTSAYNKRYLLELLERELARCEQHSRPMALLMLDIDHFKQVNDTYGHLAGDEVLQEFSRRIQSVLSADAILSRFGGEEFAVVIPECDRRGACGLGERIRQITAGDPFATSAGAIAITTSIGIAFTQDIRSPYQVTTLLETADKFLYTAKNSGRNQVCASEPS